MRGERGIRRLRKETSALSLGGGKGRGRKRAFRLFRLGLGGKGEREESTVLKKGGLPVNKKGEKRGGGLFPHVLDTQERGDKLSSQIEREGEKGSPFSVFSREGGDHVLSTEKKGLGTFRGGEKGEGKRKGRIHLTSSEEEGKKTGCCVTCPNTERGRKKKEEGVLLYTIAKEG